MITTQIGISTYHGIPTQSLLVYRELTVAKEGSVLWKIPLSEAMLSLSKEGCYKGCRSSRMKGLGYHRHVLMVIVIQIKEAPASRENTSRTTPCDEENEYSS